MSLFAKIMVIVNLILAVAFLAAAGTFLNATQSWKDKHVKDTARLADEVSNVSAQRDAQQAEKDNALGAKRSAETRAAASDAKATTAGESMIELHQLNESLRQNLESLTTNQGDLQSRLGELNTQIDALRSELETASAEKGAALDQVKTLQENVARLDQGVTDAEAIAAAGEAANESLRDQLDRITTENTALKASGASMSGAIAMKKVDAKVQAADNGVDIYILSVGSSDGVTEGYEFHVYRGNTYVATVVVDKVFPNHCSTHVKDGLKKSPIRPGDNASTYL